LAAQEERDKKRAEKEAER
jgi:hypothetical protein